MKRLFTAVITVLMAGAACGQYKTPQPPASSSPIKVETTSIQPAQSLDDARRITRDDAVKMVQDGKAVWVDVRSRADYDSGHIKGAINIPLAELQQRFRDLPLKKFLITYCA